MLLNLLCNKLLLTWLACNFFYPIIIFFLKSLRSFSFFCSAYGLNPKGVTPHPNDFSAVFSLRTVCLLSFYKKIGSFVKLTLVARGERVGINSELSFTYSTVDNMQQHFVLTQTIHSCLHPIISNTQMGFIPTACCFNIMSLSSEQPLNGF